MAYTKSQVSQFDGRYYRNLGRLFIDGKHKAKKFLLGTNQAAAEIANRRLEKLWEEVVADHSRGVASEKEMIEGTGEQSAGTIDRITGDRTLEPLGFLGRGPEWSSESLAIAEAVRRGENVFVVHLLPTDGPAEYVKRIADLRRTYSVIAFTPASMENYLAGQRDLDSMAAEKVEEAAAFASQVVKLTGSAMPSASGETLYKALEAYAQWFREHHVVEGKITDYGRTVAEGILRLMQSHPDLPLHQLNYDAVDRMATYWCNRPKSLNYGKPIAPDTVRNQLKYLRQFLKWLHRTDRFAWRDTDHVSEAAKRDVNKLKTLEERKRQSAGVPTYSIDQLSLLYRYATDHERLFMLFGLNGGFSHSECRGLRRHEVKLDGEPPVVDHIRPKTGIRGAFALWPITLQAIRWHWKHRRDGENQALVSEKGTPLARNVIVHAWNRLLDRITVDHPDFPQLPFKYLRKTSSQLMSEIGGADGETIAIFHCRGQRISEDDQADRYYRRNFPKVFAANLKVYERLQPIFDSVSGAFVASRKLGGNNISHATIESIRQLHREGMEPAVIAAKVGVALSTVNRHKPPST